MRVQEHPVGQLAGQLQAGPTQGGQPEWDVRAPRAPVQAGVVQLHGLALVGDPFAGQK